MTVKFNNLMTTRLVLVIGFLLGFFIAWGLISGDTQGRVNVLHLIIVYVFFPILSLVFSLFSMLFGQGMNLPKLISHLPLLSNEQKRGFLLQAQQPMSKWLFFYQSQLAAVSFSLASLLVFFILLFSTDVNFIWRSTLLNAENLYPILKFLATPWQFWPAAQPNLELMQLTQDSRMIMPKSELSPFGNWWQFVLAAQLFYAFLLRLIMIVLAKLFIPMSGKESANVKLTVTQLTKARSDAVELAEVVENINSNYCLNNWCGLDEALVRAIEIELGFEKTSDLKAGPLATDSEQMVSERWQETQVLIVKGWEPPLAELADFMQNGSGYLLPLDWNESKLIGLSRNHLDEWRRFITQLPRWQLLQLPNLEAK